MDTQIIELEKKYWQGMENHSYETVRNLTHFPCIVAGKNGVQSVDEATFKKMFESGDGNKIKVVNISDFETQIIGESAIIAYVIELTIMDKENESPTKCACTSTWLKENNEWLCALHTETELTQQ
ncbi:MAG: nuclear transport factor 2 family protein [Chitinophagaceae bacterium]|jgi:hypothetical protein